MRKRSKYRPKGVRLDNMTWVQSGLKRVENVSACATIKIRNHDAMNTLRLGSATKEEINTLINAMNVAEALANRGWGEDWKAEIAMDDVMEALRLRKMRPVVETTHASQ
jgi:hypothetical protein